MLPPCDLFAERGDSLGSRILLQTWLGLVTLGGKIPSWSDKTSDAHNKSIHLMNVEHRMHVQLNKITRPFITSH